MNPGRACALAMAGLLTAAAADAATLYKCTGADGKTSYSNLKCAGDTNKELRVFTPQAPPPPARADEWAMDGVEPQPLPPPGPAQEVIAPAPPPDKPRVQFIRPPRDEKRRRKDDAAIDKDMMR